MFKFLHKHEPPQVPDDALVDAINYLAQQIERLGTSIATRDAARAADLARLTDHITRVERMLCRIDHWASGRIDGWPQGD